MANDKKILTSDQVTKKTFSYTLDGVEMSFTLRVDVKKDLKAAKEILTRAIADFEAEIAKL